MATAVGLAAFTAGAEIVFEPAPTPGRASHFSWPGMKYPLEVSLPFNYTPDHNWPVIFFYHGTEGQPGTEFFRLYTKGEDYILVGMDYLKRGPMEGTAAEHLSQAKSELAALQAVRAALSETLKIDPHEVYLAGFSKGGWMVSMMAEQPDADVAGVIIQGAGRAQRAASMPDRRLILGKPIYLGIGSDDPGYLAACRAAGFWKERGAVVTLEEYTGQGHVRPTKTPILEAWFFVRKYRRAPTDETLREALKTWFLTAYEEAGKLTEPSQKYLALTAITEDPRYELCGRATRQRVEEAIGKTRNDPIVQRLWRADQAKWKLIRQELSATYVSDYEALIEGWKRLATSYGGTAAGDMAPREVGRLTQIVAQVKSGDMGPEAKTNQRLSAPATISVDTRD